jgi:hypothetical protein
VRARHKRVWASVERTPEQVTEEVFQEARRPDLEGKRPWVMLVDGHEGQLKDIHAAIERHGVEVTLILDFIHVLEYLWKAAWCFFIPGCQEAEAWVGERALQILFGNILWVETGELAIVAVVFTLIALVHFLFYKEFLFVSFDFETARAQGLRAHFWNFLLYLTLGIAIAVAIRSMGVLLVFAFLVAPPMTARLLSDRMGRMFALAMAFGVVSVPIGLSLAFAFDLPTGTAVAGGWP